MQVLVWLRHGPLWWPCPILPLLLVIAPLAMTLWQMQLHPWHGMRASMCLTPLVALVLPPMPTPPGNVNWCPDITLIHGARDGNHVLADVTCPSVVTRAALPAACHMPLATAIAATAMKHARYGNDMKVPRRVVAIEIRQGTCRISRKPNCSI